MINANMTSFGQGQGHQRSNNDIIWPLLKIEASKNLKLYQNSVNRWIIILSVDSSGVYIRKVFENNFERKLQVQVKNSEKEWKQGARGNISLEWCTYGCEHETWYRAFIWYIDHKKSRPNSNLSVKAAILDFKMAAISKMFLHVTRLPRPLELPFFDLYPCF